MRSLEKLIDEINEYEIIYDIHQCNAGWGFVLYRPVEEGESWRRGLHVEFYRPTLRQATDDTLNYLKERNKEEK